MNTVLSRLNFARVWLMCELRELGTIYDSRNSLIKGRAYSITERRVPELIPVPGSQPASDVSHKTRR